MSGRHRWSELTKNFSPDMRRLVDEAKSEIRAEMALHELRRARALAQRDLAKHLNVRQPLGSTIEERADAYVSSLRSYIEAVGGKLKIIAEFPSGEVSINSFCDVGDLEDFSANGDESTRT